MNRRILYFLAILLLAGCASPQKSFRKGNYEKAYNSALKNLQKGKSDRKDKQILNKSFNELMKKHQSSTQDLVNSNHIEDWEDAYLQGNNISNLYEKGQQYLDNDFDSPMEKIMAENEILKADIISNYWSLAEESMRIYDEDGDKVSAQEAFRMYHKVDSYGGKSQYPQLNSLMSDALEAGTIHIVVEADSWEFSQEWEIDQRFDDIERASLGNFTKVYFEENIQNPDCLMKVEFGSLDIDESSSRSTERFSERIIDGYETVTDTSGTKTQEPIYKTVNGSVVINQIERRYTWSARVRINEFTNYCDFRNNTFDARIIDRREDYDLSGDQRAIPDRYKTNGSDFSLSDREVAEDLIEEIYDDFRRYYF